MRGGPGQPSLAPAEFNRHPDPGLAYQSARRVGFGGHGGMIASVRPRAASSTMRVAHRLVEESWATSAQEER